MEFNKIMVIGAGQMGAGIAQVAAQTGIRVLLNDVSEEICKKGLSGIQKNLTRMVEKGKLTQNAMEGILKNIATSTKLEDATGCDLVIEAIVENMKVKGEVFAKLDAICPPETIFATNTSSLPITEIAAFTKRPEKVIGMHFMNPVPVMKLVEIIRGIATTDEIYGYIKALSIRMGKTPVEVRDVPGFVSNRVLQMMINEAIYCVYEGVATPEDIDHVMRLGMNHPMGPLQLADFIGLDTILSIMQIMHEGYGDSKYRPCPLLRQYVKAGWVGKKAGKGFYDYN